MVSPSTCSYDCADLGVAFVADVAMGRKLLSVFSVLNQNGAPRLKKAAVIRMPQMLNPTEKLLKASHEVGIRNRNCDFANPCCIVSACFFNSSITKT